MRRAISTTLAAATLAASAAVPGGAGAASRCDSDLIVLSRNSMSLASTNPHAAVCAPGWIVPDAKALADGEQDFRVLTPLSDRVMIRYTADDIPRRPSVVRARLDGLGLSRKVVYLARVDVDDTGLDPSFIYEGPETEISPVAQGCLRVRAWHAEKRRVKRDGAWVSRWVVVWRATTTYHTFETASC